MTPLLTQKLLTGVVVIKKSSAMQEGQTLPRRRVRRLLSSDPVAFIFLSSQKPKYMRAQFDYNPVEDGHLPCAEVGLQFSTGDVLSVLNDTDDKQWWQASKYSEERVKVGLIPSSHTREQ